MENKSIWIALLLVALMIFGAIYFAKHQQSLSSGSAEFVNLSAKEFQEALTKDRNNPDTVILDVRTLAEYNSGHIEGAKEIDFYAADFKQKLNTLDKSKHYYIYCRSGHRSGETMRIMKELGFKRVTNLQYGMNDWKANNLPLVH